MTKKQKRELKRILIAGVLYAVFMILDKAGILPAVFGNRLFAFLLYLVPYLIVGYPVVRKAFLGIIHRQLFDESFLMFVATVGAFASGESSEAVAVMLFYQVGELFQGYAVGKSRRSIRDLMDIAPEYANREAEDGSVETIDPDEVRVGDILVIRPGEKIPVDGIVTEGAGMINTAALTGESVPRSVSKNISVISGCINGDGLLKIRAVKKYEDSTVSRILELVENASEKKSRTENFITRFARYYTPVVVFGAIALAVIPSLISGNWMTWILRSCTFLVISCPCALVISVPLAFFGGIGAASRQGILVKGSNYLELLSKLDTVVTDKTGTLTRGTFRVTDVICAPGVDRADLLRKAALAEGLSTHPIAVSIREAFERQDGVTAVNTNLIQDTKNISGQGLIVHADESVFLVGNERLLREHGVAFDPVDGGAATTVYIAENGSCLGTVLIRDEVKPEAREAIAGMRRQGVSHVVMLTGDRASVAEAVGRELGVDQVYSELLPQDKVAKVESLLSGRPEHKNLAFIGDGINDAPVLARADVGIAMGSLGSDAAIEAADVVIMDDNLNRLPEVMAVARKTVGISTQNIVFALAVKLLILVLGAFGLAGMWAAVFADVGVAVLCILNSMRLLRRNRKA